MATPVSDPRRRSGARRAALAGAALARRVIPAVGVSRATLRPALAAALLLAACDGAPPLESLPLRDALGADPAVILRLPPEARRALAERFEVERRRAVTSESLPVPAGRGPAARLRAV